LGVPWREREIRGDRRSSRPGADAGVERPGPHQIYRHPRVEVEVRALGELHPDEIRVRMIYAGLCGTDAHLVTASPETGYIRSSAPALIPPEGRIIGHEGWGRSSPGESG